MLRHVAVDDCGRILNPLLVAGQQHGGIAQGAAQALYEWMQYDDDGNPLTSNLLDYAIPSAAELCSFEVSNTQTDSPRNPLGAKGIGESGTIGSTPAIQNAVVDARQPPRRDPHRHAVHGRARLARHPGRFRLSGGHLADVWSARTQPVNASIPSISRSNRIDRKRSNECCAPGSSTYTTELRRHLSYPRDELARRLNRHVGVVVAMRDEERRCVGIGQPER